MKLLHNAKFYSMGQENQYYTALLIENEKIKELYKQKPDIESIEKIDLKGKFVYPGFIDTHTHSFEGGLYSLGANLENASSLTEVFEIISETQPLNGKLFAYHFDETQIKEKRFPTRAELDLIFPDIPILLRRVDGHSCVINSKAAKVIDWNKSLPSSFNGYLSEEANSIASNWFHENLGDEGILKAYQKAANIALNEGHTTVHTMIGNGYKNELHFKLIQENLQQFPIDFVLYPQITDVKKAIELGSPRIGGCILADGSFGSHSAAILESYSDNPETSGTLYHSDEFWKNFITEAHSNNLQIAIHCIGDAAISQILKFYEQVEKNEPKDLKHMIIHNELTSDKMLDRMARAKVSAVMQPMFDRLWAGKNGLYEKHLGKERTLRTNRLASINDRNILLTGGSDWYITDLSALKGIDAATRIHNEKERLTPYQAVEIYTKNAAILSSHENMFGTLKKDLLADLVITDSDIFTSNSIKNIKISAVVKKGKYIKVKK